MGRFDDKLDHQVLEQVHALCVRVLVVAKAVHHTPQLLAEESLPARRTRLRLLLIVLVEQLKVNAALQYNHTR